LIKNYNAKIRLNKEGGFTNLGKLGENVIETTKGKKLRIAIKVIKGKKCQ
jgi:hypothetical protein